MVLSFKARRLARAMLQFSPVPIAGLSSRLHMLVAPPSRLTSSTRQETEKLRKEQAARRLMADYMGSQKRPSPIPKKPVVPGENAPMAVLYEF